MQLSNHQEIKQQCATVYLYCGSCLHQVQDSSQDSKSISQYSCAVHTLGCSVDAWYSNPEPRRSGHPSPAGIRPDRNTRPLYPVPPSTHDCSRLSAPNTHLKWRNKAREEDYCWKEGILKEDIVTSEEKSRVRTVRQQKRMGFLSRHTVEKQGVMDAWKSRRK